MEVSHSAPPLQGPQLDPFASQQVAPALHCPLPVHAVAGVPPLVPPVLLAPPVELPLLDAPALLLPLLVPPAVLGPDPVLLPELVATAPVVALPVEPPLLAWPVELAPAPVLAWPVLPLVSPCVPPLVAPALVLPVVPALVEFALVPPLAVGWPEATQRPSRQTCPPGQSPLELHVNLPDGRLERQPAASRSAPPRSEPKGL